ncbi:MAG: hypothetical protein OQK77_10395 [Psychromonas sp.]|nr:hypothetical protein [Psychromonas sp.]
MLIKITFHIILLLFSTSIINTQYFDSVEKESERILVSLSDGDSDNSTDLTELKNLLSSDFENDVSESITLINQQSIDSLRNHLTEFESKLKNISTDSAFVLFNEWYLHFQNIFYEYLKEKFFSSDKTKILFFSTSMSCHCTLEMCKKQLVEILKLKRETGDSYSFLVVDSYWNNELQLKYGTYFAPSVLVFDQSNELILKIEYEEEMIEQLTAYLSGSDKI